MKTKVTEILVIHCHLSAPYNLSPTSCFQNKTADTLSFSKGNFPQTHQRSLSAVSICFLRGLEALARKIEGKYVHSSESLSSCLAASKQPRNPHQLPRNQHPGMHQDAVFVAACSMKWTHHQHVSFPNRFYAWGTVWTESFQGAFCSGHVSKARSRTQQTVPRGSAAAWCLFPVPFPYPHLLPGCKRRMGPAWIPPQELPCPLLHHHHIPALSPAQPACCVVLVWSPANTHTDGKELQCTHGDRALISEKGYELLTAKAMNNLSAFSSSHTLPEGLQSFKNTVFQSVASRQLNARSTLTVSEWHTTSSQNHTSSCWSYLWLTQAALSAACRAGTASHWAVYDCGYRRGIPHSATPLLLVSAGAGSTPGRAAHFLAAERWLHSAGRWHPLGRSTRKTDSPPDPSLSGWIMRARQMK